MRDWEMIDRRTPLDDVIAAEEGCAVGSEIGEDFIGLLAWLLCDPRPTVVFSRVAHLALLAREETLVYSRSLQRKLWNVSVDRRKLSRYAKLYVKCVPVVAGYCGFSSGEEYSKRINEQLSVILDRESALGRGRAVPVEVADPSSVFAYH